MQNFHHNIGFREKNANFYAENWQTSLKIVSTTSAPGHPAGISAPVSAAFDGIPKIVT
jgi:hypothetical protein